MPSIQHEVPLELLRRNPILAAVLLAGLGVAVPENATAVMAPTDLTASLPAELRADAVVLLSGSGDARMAVIAEVQLRYDKDKQYAWPSYLAQVRAAHRCPAALLVVCPDPRTAASCRAPIITGHPGFDLAPLVIDADSTPLPGALGPGPELAILGVITGAIDLSQDSGRLLVLNAIAAADLDEERLETYTHLVRAAAPAAARDALEALMTTVYKDDFIDRYKAEGRTEGKAEGAAQMILRVLSARGMEVPGEVRERVLGCSDGHQLETWGDRAATAVSLDAVFGP